MTSLAELQEGFSRHLQGGDHLPPGLAGAEEEQKRRLSVYRNNVFYSLTTALSDLYPVIKQLVGDDFFRHAARQYLQKHPPHQAAMVHFGSEFPGYLQRNELQTQLEYLADVARLELARHKSFHALDASALEPEVFQELGVEALLTSRLALHPSLQMLHSQWAIYSIWAAHQSARVNLSNVQLNESESVLILRLDTNPKLYAVEPGLIDLLGLVGKGATLSAAIEATVETYPDFDTGTALAFCITQGVFTEFHSQN